jgi:hypothetical protein
MLGLVTSDSPQMTRYGKMAWIGIQLSPDKAGAGMVYGTSELIRFLVHNTGPFYHGEAK